jgi:hypothetical protein
MSTKPNPPSDEIQVLKSLKAIDLTAWNYQFWVLHRDGRQSPHFSYTARRLETSENIQERLVRRISQRIEWANEVKEYQAEQVDLDKEDGESGLVLVAGVENTELPSIVEAFDEGVDAAQISELEELSGAYGYAVELTDPDGKEDPLIAFRKISASWKVRIETPDRVIWKNKKLVDANIQPFFQLDGQFDFLSFREKIFILDRRHFERGLNLRNGMQAKAKEVLKLLEAKSFFVDMKILNDKCLNNLQHLRRLCTVEKRGFYKDEKFLNRVIATAKSENWSAIQLKDNMLEVTEENIKDVLTVLADQRLKSPTTETTYDVDASEVYSGKDKKEAPTPRKPRSVKMGKGSKK